MPAGSAYHLLSCGSSFLKGMVLAGVCFWTALSVASGEAGIRFPEPRRTVDEWRADLRREALSSNIPPAVFDGALEGFTPDPRVLAADRRQPEFTDTVGAYLGRVVSDSRIATGRQLIEHHRSLFDRLETHYGVDRHVVAAIWGVETGYGANRGRFNIIHALATLAYDGRRRQFARRQLLAALNILAQGDVAPENMVGSWAGAMGHSQFIPSSYHAYAQDFDGVQGKDIWNSVPDALASTAHYLKESGWRRGQSWGYEVRLPAGFDYSLADSRIRKTIRSWVQLGVTPVNTAVAYRTAGRKASLLLPSGHRGPAFLVLDNFRVIRRYNNAVSYALAVGHLADRLRGSGVILGPWPADARSLTLKDRKMLQRLLLARGYDIGDIDGIVGAKTRAAVRSWQAVHGLPADGFPTALMLDILQGRQFPQPRRWR